MGPTAVIVGDPTLAKWGRNIALLRERMGLSQQELAEAIGVRYPTVWRWEHGKMEPRRHHKAAIAAELNTAVEVLFS